MSAARLILRIIMATVTVIAVGAIGVLGFMTIEPFFTALGEPTGFNGATPASNLMLFSSLGVLGLLLVLVLWFVYAPIRSDRRQQFRR